MENHSIDQFNVSTFLEHIHSNFYIQLHNDHQVELELVKVDDISTQDVEKGIGKNQERFSLLFKGSNEIVLPQQIYELHHLCLGNLSLFLVPVGRDEDGSLYEAVFNRIKKNKQ